MKKPILSDILKKHVLSNFQLATLSNLIKNTKDSPITLDTEVIKLLSIPASEYLRVFEGNKDLYLTLCDILVLDGSIPGSHTGPGSIIFEGYMKETGLITWHFKEGQYEIAGLPKAFKIAEDIFAENVLWDKKFKIVQKMRILANYYLIAERAEDIMGKKYFLDQAKELQKVEYKFAMEL